MYTGINKIRMSIDLSNSLVTSEVFKAHFLNTISSFIYFL